MSNNKNGWKKMDDFADLYRRKLNLPNAVFTYIDHEDAMVAKAFKIILPTGNEYILKACERPNDFLREVYFLQCLKKSIPVPRIIETVQPEPGISGAILMECLPGTLLSEQNLTDELAFEIGSNLARIHLHRETGFGDIIQPQTLCNDARIPFTQKFEEGYTECSDHLPKQLLEQCRRYYDTHIDLLQTVDGPCIIHRDFRPGNILVSHVKLQGIIDWSSARAGFSQEDFCPLEHGEWPSHKNSILAGYRSIRPVPDYISIIPLLRMARAFATIGFTVKSGTWNNKHSRVYRRDRQFLDDMFGSNTKEHGTSTTKQY